MKTVNVDFARITTRKQFPDGSRHYSVKICELGEINSNERAVASLSWLLEKVGNDPRVEGVGVRVDQIELVRELPRVYNGVYVRLRLGGSGVPIQVLASGEHILPDEEREAEAELEKEMLAVGAELQEFIGKWEKTNLKGQ